MKRTVLIAVSVVLLSFAIPSTALSNTITGGGNPDDIALQQLRIPFIENQGQYPGEVAFYARTFVGTVFVTTNGKTVLTIPAADDKGNNLAIVREEILGTTQVFPRGIDKSVTRINNIIGSDPAGWRNDIPTYSSVSLGEVYEGIKFHLRAYGNSVEKVFTVSPGADPAKIRLSAKGVEGLEVADDGKLSMQTLYGAVTYSAPVAYQETDSGVKYVDIAYAVQGDTYGFKLGPYDIKQPIIIDPILGATYLGGDPNDVGYSLAFDDSGDLYVAGVTYSSSFPGINGTSAQDTLYGTTDIFLAHLDPSLGILYQATYLGGSDFDYPGLGNMEGPTIAVHPTNDNIYLTGYTMSMNFPGVSAGAQSTKVGGAPDAFVAVLEPDLGTILAATYFGGGSWDMATAMAIDPSTGDVYITGRTQSSPLPGTTGGFDPTLSGTWDGFAALFSMGLDVLDQATYIGGSGTDWPFSITTPSDGAHPDYGSVYVTGETDSASFPGTTGGAQETHGGTTDAFIIELSSSLTTGQATFLGGTGSETGYRVKVHPDTGDIYVCGSTGSFDLPGASGGAQAAYAGTGGKDVFVSSLASHLGTLRQSTYLGGDASENNCSVFIDPVSGDIYVAGTTFSDDFPGTSGGAQPDSAGDDDVFAARLDEGLTTLYQATYIGGSSKDMSFGVNSPSITNGIYITGLTWSGDFPGMSDTFSFQATHGGAPYPFGQDAFIVRLDSTLSADYEPDINVTPLAVDFGSAEVGTTISSQLYIYNQGGADLAVSDVTISDETNFSFDIENGAGACSSYATTLDLFRLPPMGSCTVSISFHPGSTGSFLADLTIYSDDLDEGEVDVELAGTGTMEAPCWDVSTVDDGVEDVGIAVDADDNVHMCYFKPQSSGADTLVLRYATLSSGGSTAWAFTDLDTFLPDPDFYEDTMLDLMTQCSVEVGTDGLVHIAYTDSGARRLKYAWGDGASGFDIVEVDYALRGEVRVGLRTSGDPFVVYRGQWQASDFNTYRGVLYATGSSGVFSEQGIAGDVPEDYLTGLFSDAQGGVILAGGRLHEDSATGEKRFECADLWERLAAGYYSIETSCVVSAESAEFISTGSGRYFAGLDNIVGYVDFNSWAPDFYNLNMEEWSSYPNGDLSLAVDSLENPHLLYFEQVDNRLTHTKVNGNLLSTVNMGAPVSSSWQDAFHQVTTTVASSLHDIRRSSMALDSSDTTHLAFLDAEDGKVKYAVPAAGGCEILSVSPMRWRFDDRAPGSSVIRPFFVTNLGDTALSVQAVDFQDLTGLTTEVFETVDCVSPASDVPALQLGESIPGGEMRAYCVRLAEEDLIDYRAVMILQSENGPITVDLAADQLTGSDSKTNSGSCNTLYDDGEIDAVPIIVLVFFTLGLLWRRRRLRS